MSDSPGGQSSFRVSFAPLSAGRSGEVAVPIPPLGSRAVEELFDRGEFEEEREGVRLWRAGGLLIGCVREPVAGEALSILTERVYAKVFRAAGARSLFRIWNYVPQINAVCAGLENYRAFCVGRSRAFEATFGAGFAARVPAASAVGCGGGELIVIFVAGEAAPRHFENPQQIPAYEYPAEHGPRPPSFARATLAGEGSRRWAFISGTSAIRGHATVGAGSFAAQLECTLENLRLVAVTAGLGERLTLPGETRRLFKVYLRHAADYARTRARLEETFLTNTDEAIYLQADICRAELDVEIEVTVVGTA